MRGKITANETLIIFDVVKEYPAALNSLKYFKERAPEYHIISVGSLLGTLLADPKSYPIGMVNILGIDPLTYEEFLRAVEPNLYNYYIQVKPDEKIH